MKNYDKYGVPQLKRMRKDHRLKKEWPAIDKVIRDREVKQ